MQTIVTVTNREYYGQLILDAHEGGTVWTLTRRARRGDRVALYVTSPYQAVVAEARCDEDAWIEEDPNSEWFGHHFAEMSELRMIRPHIKRAELIEAFPRWGYWRQPRTSVVVPAPYQEEFRRFLSR